jgi:hypothetical protein
VFILVGIACVRSEKQAAAPIEAVPVLDEPVTTR